NLVAQIGPTWGDYVRMLSDNAAYLGRLGVTVTDVNELYAFELQQALGLKPVATVASAIDASLPTPGLPLQFGRSFGNTITERYRVGPFGRGWAAPWLISLEQQPDRTVIIHQSPDAQRRLKPDSRYPGRCFAAAGDEGVLVKRADGSFDLTEADGALSHFTADGLIGYWQDANGNRITAEFTANKLTKLTHSSGAWITFTYTGSLITSVTDSAGRVTTYTYDASNTHLLSVTGPAGTKSYTYSLGNGTAREHALLSVTDASGVTRHFAYDDRGRLVSTYLGNDLQPLRYAYDTAGKVTVTPASAAS